MGSYILKRLASGLLMALIAASISFMAMRLLPGDPVVLYTAQSQQAMTEENMNHVRHQLGLDKPLATQYFAWINDLVHGRLGHSIYYHEKVSVLLADRLPVTLQLGLGSLMLNIACGIPLGVVAAVRRGRWADMAITGIINLGIATPVFWIAGVMIYLFGVKFAWLPIGGYCSPLTDLWLNVQQTIMPVVCLSIPGIAMTARQMRASMQEILEQDYIRTAWAKGIDERTIIIRHAVKNSLIPVLTVLGAGVGMILGGTVLIETVFAIPGMGRLMAMSIMQKDYVVIQSATLVLGFIMIAVNLSIDIAYGWCDPRIRYS